MARRRNRRERFEAKYERDPGYAWLAFRDEPESWARLTDPRQLVRMRRVLRRVAKHPERAGELRNRGLVRIRRSDGHPTREDRLAYWRSLLRAVAEAD